MANELQTFFGDVEIQGSLNVRGGLDSRSTSHIVTRLGTTDTNLKTVEATAKAAADAAAAAATAAREASVILTSSVPSLTRSRAGLFSPSTVTFSARLPDGTPFAGRFIIEETADNTTWIEVYRSTSDESSHTHTPSVGICAIRPSICVVEA